MRRRRNRRPAGTTLAANESFPMSDRSSLFVTLHSPSHELVRDEISCSLSAGNLSCCREESRTMPKKVMQVAEPSHFSVATGTPILSANTVVSLLHAFLNLHGMQEKTVTLQADNCVWHQTRILPSCGIHNGES